MKNLLAVGVVYLMLDCIEINGNRDFLNQDGAIAEGKRP